jgi:hypothetical protein
VTRIRRHLSYANVMSTIAVIVAVAGGSTAVAVSVSTSKKSDINKKGNIRAGRVTAKKLADGNVVASKLARIEIITTSSPGGATATCPAGSVLVAGGGTASGGERLSSSVPSPQGNGWSASGGAAPATAFALCLRGVAGS